MIPPTLARCCSLKPLLGRPPGGISTQNGSVPGTTPTTDVTWTYPHITWSLQFVGTRYTQHAVTTSLRTEKQTLIACNRCHFPPAIVVGNARLTVPRTKNKSNVFIELRFMNCASREYSWAMKAKVEGQYYVCIWCCVCTPIYGKCLVCLVK